MREGVGKTYDLQSLFDRLNRLYFDQSLKLAIRWSKRYHSAARKRVLLGSYSHDHQAITLSRRLDDLRVPLFFVEHILFHEMLHAVFPSEKHRMHTEKFRSFEKLHPDYERAHDWEKQSIELLFERPQKRLPLAKRARQTLSRPQKHLKTIFESPLIRSAVFFSLPLACLIIPFVVFLFLRSHIDRIGFFHGLLKILNGLPKP